MDDDWSVTWLWGNVQASIRNFNSHDHRRLMLEALPITRPVRMWSSRIYTWVYPQIDPSCWGACHCYCCLCSGGSAAVKPNLRTCLNVRVGKIGRCGLLRSTGYVCNQYIQQIWKNADSIRENSWICHALPIVFSIRRLWQTAGNWRRLRFCNSMRGWTPTGSHVATLKQLKQCVGAGVIIFWFLFYQYILHQDFLFPFVPKKWRRQLREVFRYSRFPYRYPVRCWNHSLLPPDWWNWLDRPGTRIGPGRLSYMLYDQIPDSNSS